MTKQEMWEAVQNSDANYDGMFFYAVKTTGIFCRPSCKSKPPKRENVCFFETAGQAESAGFRPCKRCRSDLLEYKPMHEIAADIKKKLDGTDAIYNEKTLENIGLTSRRITDIFKQEYGMTPKEYADLRRLSEAEKMLVDTNEKMIDIAYAAGFSSLYAFNRFFKKQLGQTPSEYRKKQRQITEQAKHIF